MFSDPEKRRTINKITHPEIYREIQWQVLRLFFKGKLEEEVCVCWRRRWY